MGRVFSFAPMSGLFWAATLFLWGLPLLFIYLSFTRPDAPGLLPVGVAMVVLYLAIWIYSRPREFEVDDRNLTIRWPIRSRRISRRDIRGASVMTGRDLRAALGFAVRIGAGGLFGTFGWLWSPRRGLVTIYTSRADRMVAVERTNGRMMVLSPSDPEAFVAALNG